MSNGNGDLTTDDRFLLETIRVYSHCGDCDTCRSELNTYIENGINKRTAVTLLAHRNRMQFVEACSETSRSKFERTNKELFADMHVVDVRELKDWSLPILPYEDNGNKNFDSIESIRSYVFYPKQEKFFAAIKKFAKQKLDINLPNKLKGYLTLAKKDEIRPFSWQHTHSTEEDHNHEDPERGLAARKRRRLHCPICCH